MTYLLPSTPTGSTQSLEESLGCLLAALVKNGNDDWEGKPRQECFRMYGPPGPSAHAQLAPTQALQAGTTSSTADRRNSLVGTQSAKEKEDGTQSATTAPRSNEISEEMNNGHSDSIVAYDDARASLDTLMGEYVTALRGLRAVNHSTENSSQDAEPASTEVGGESTKARQHEFKKGCSVPADASEGTVLPHVIVDDVDVQTLLDALDRLPPLPKKRGM